MKKQRRRLKNPRIRSDGYAKDIVYSLEIDRIRANSAQPRKDFEIDSIIRLADSIRRYGILQPLSVRRIRPGEQEDCVRRGGKKANLVADVLSLGLGSADRRGEKRNETAIDLSNGLELRVSRETKTWDPQFQLPCTVATVERGGDGLSPLGGRDGGETGAFDVDKMARCAIDEGVRCSCSDEPPPIFCESEANLLHESGEACSLNAGEINLLGNLQELFYSETDGCELALGDTPSVADVGVLPSDGCEYELIAGERRLRAAKMLGLRCVPCIIVDVNDAISAELALVENMLRENLNMFEQAAAFAHLSEKYSLTQEEIAARMSLSQSAVANKMRLLRLSEQERELILEASLTERHARAFLRVSRGDLRESCIRYVIDEKLNVSDTDKYISAVLLRTETPNRQEEKPAPAAPSPEKLCSNIYKFVSRMQNQSGNCLIVNRKSDEKSVVITLTVRKSL